MNRVYNFSAGPSMLPEAVLRRAAGEMLDYQGSGQSVMEMSHRSKVYEGIINSAESLLREVMNIPDNYKVLFLQGGASSQFAMVPMNLMTKNNKADFVITGQWATKAYKEAARYGAANVVASSKDKTFSYIPELDPASFDKEADYFHICMNNTIYGTVWHQLPDTGSVPLVADISSCILSKPIDVSKFGLLYAGAQKNVAPAGLTHCDCAGRPARVSPWSAPPPCSTTRLWRRTTPCTTAPLLAHLTSASWCWNGSKTTSEGWKNGGAQCAQIPASL